MIRITNDFYLAVVECDHIKLLVTLTVITLRGFHFTSTFVCNGVTAGTLTSTFMVHIYNLVFIKRPNLFVVEDFVAGVLV